MKSLYENRSCGNRINMLCIALICSLAVMISGCTHNNGDIGPLFGQWQVTAVDVDGTSVDGYDGNVYWSFQSHTVEVKALYPHHECLQSFGNWALDGNILTLSFPDADRQPPEESLLPSEAVLKVLELDKNRLVLRLIKAGDSLITYTLRKW